MLKIAFEDFPRISKIEGFQERFQACGGKYFRFNVPRMRIS
jgi:hypothetical protein